MFWVVLLIQSPPFSFKFGSENYFVFLLDNFPLPTIFSSSPPSVLLFSWINSFIEIFRRNWIVQECPSPVGADGQNAWVILGRLCSDAQLSCTVTIGCCPMSDLYHILFASFSCHRARDPWNFFTIIGVSRGEIAKPTISSFLYGSIKLIAELLDVSSNKWISFLSWNARWEELPKF